MSEKLYKDLVSTSSVSLVTQVIGMISGILFPRLLGPDQWGLWSITKGLIGLLGPFAQLAMSTGLVTYVSKYKKNKEKVSSFVNSAYFMVIVFSFIVSIAIISLSKFLAESIFQDSRLTILLVLGSLILFFSQLNIVNRDYFRGFKNFKKYNLLRIIGSLSRLLIPLSFFIVFSYMAIYLAISQVILYSIISILVLVYLYRTEDVFQIFHKPKKRESIKLLKLCLPMVFTATLFVIMRSIDKVIIGYFMETRYVGIYSVAGKLPFFIGASFAVFSPVLLPTLSERKEKGKSSALIINEIFSLLLSLSIPLIIFLIFFGENILGIVWGPDYRIGAQVLSITSIMIFLFSAYRLLGTSMVAAEKTKAKAIAMGIAVVTNILLNIILIPLIGIEGAAIATVFSFVVLFVFIIYISKKDYNFSLSNINLKMIIPLLFSLLVVGYLLKLLINGIMSLIISGFVFLAIFIICSELCSPLWYREARRFMKEIVRQKIR